MTRTVYGFSGEQIKAGMFDAKGPIEPTTLTREHLAEMERMRMAMKHAHSVLRAYMDTADQHLPLTAMHILESTNPLLRRRYELEQEAK
jgi:hypothetical protein